MVHDCACVSAQICFINSARAREGTTPNATLIQAHVNGVPVLVVVQMRDIKADEEILVHYGQPYWRWFNDKVRREGCAWSWSWIFMRSFEFCVLRRSASFAPSSTCPIRLAATSPALVSAGFRALAKTSRSPTRHAPGSAGFRALSTPAPRRRASHWSRRFPGAGEDQPRADEPRTGFGGFPSSNQDQPRADEPRTGLGGFPSSIQDQPRADEQSGMGGIGGSSPEKRDLASNFDSVAIESGKDQAPPTSGKDKTDVVMISDDSDDDERPAKTAKTSSSRQDRSHIFDRQEDFDFTKDSDDDE